MKQVILHGLLACLLIVLVAGQGCPPDGGDPPDGDNGTDGDNAGDNGTNGDNAGFPCSENEYSAGVERIGVIESADGGATWTFLGHACFHAPELTPVDPDPVIQNGRIVLYFYDITVQQTFAQDQVHVMYRAESDDGLDFSVPTTAYSTSEMIITDPMVILLSDGTYRMYLSAGTLVPSASGSDGITFTADSGNRSEVGGVPGVLLLPDGRIRLFVCGAGGIISLISSDSLTFDQEDGARISDDGAGSIICDPHPIQLQDGSYLMTYKQRPVGETGPDADLVYLATSDDGYDWTTIDSPVVTGSVPGIVQLQDGTLLIYYVDFAAGP